MSFIFFGLKSKNFIYFFRFFEIFFCFLSDKIRITRFSSIKRILIRSPYNYLTLTHKIYQISIDIPVNKMIDSAESYEAVDKNRKSWTENVKSYIKFLVRLDLKQVN
jgi:hypothetical protein